MEGNPLSKLYNPNSVIAIKTNEKTIESLDNLLGGDKDFEVLRTFTGEFGETIQMLNNPVKKYLENAEDIKTMDYQFNDGYIDPDSLKPTNYMELSDEEHKAFFQKKMNQHNENGDKLHKRLDLIVKLHEAHGYTLNFKLSKPLRLRTGANTYETVEELEGRISRSANYGRWLFQPKGMTARALFLDEDIIKNLKSIETCTNVKSASANYLKAKKLRDQNLWSDKELDIAYKDRPLRSIKGLFTSDILQKVDEAIKNKTNYSGYGSNGYNAKRGYRVDVKFDDQGNGKAWFSSEKRGMGHGDYYILINSTTAVFAEKD